MRMMLKGYAIFTAFLQRFNQNKIFKILAIFIFLSWAAAIQAADLPTEVAAILPTPREHTVAHFDGHQNIYIMGGSNEVNLYNEVLKYDITKFGHIEEVGYFPTGIAEGALGVDTMGNIFYLGGHNGNDKSTIAWKVNPLLPTPFNFGNFEEFNPLSCSVSDGLGNVFLIGGVGTLDAKRNIVKFNTTSKTATVVAQLPIGLQGSACAWAEGEVYIFGGLDTNFEYSKKIIKFTPTKNIISVLEMSLSSGILRASAVTVGTDIYIVGGENPNTEVHHVSKFDAHVNTLVDFELPSHANAILAGISTVHVLKTNRIYVIGGYTLENNKMKSLDQIFYIQLEQPIAHLELGGLLIPKLLNLSLVV